MQDAHRGQCVFKPVFQNHGMPWLHTEEAVTLAAWAATFGDKALVAARCAFWFFRLPNSPMCRLWNICFVRPLNRKWTWQFCRNSRWNIQRNAQINPNCPTTTSQLWCCHGWPSNDNCILCLGALRSDVLMESLIPVWFHSWIHSVSKFIPITFHGFPEF